MKPCSFFEQKSKFFTLVELLVVVSIISTLASLGFGGLQSARSKATDSRLKESLSSMRNQAQIYYTNNDTYGTQPMSTGLSTCTSGVFSDSKIRQALTMAETAGIGPVTCVANGDFYSLSVPLKSKPTHSWCIDSLGYSGSVEGTIETNPCSGSVPDSGGVSSACAPTGGCPRTMGGSTCISYSASSSPSTCDYVARTSTCTAGAWDVEPFAQPTCEPACVESGGCPVTDEGGTCTTYFSATTTDNCADLATVSTCTMGEWDVTPLTHNSCEVLCAAAGACPETANEGTCTTYSSATSTAACSTVSRTSTCSNGAWSAAPYDNAACAVVCAPSGACPETADGGTCTTYSESTPTNSCSSVARTSTCTGGTWSEEPFINASCSSGCPASGVCAAASDGATCTTYSSATPVGTCESVALTSTCSNGTWSDTPLANASCSAGCPASGACPLTASGASCDSYSAPTVTSPAACSSIKISSTCNAGTWSTTPGPDASCTVAMRSCAATGGCALAAHNGTCTSYSTSTPTGACSTVDQSSTCTDGTWAPAPLASATCASGCATAGVCAAAPNGSTCTTYSSATPIGSCSSVSQTSTCNAGSWSSVPLANASCSSGCAASGACAAGANGTVCTSYTAASVTSPAACTSVKVTSTCNNGSWSATPGTNASCTVAMRSCAATGGCPLTAHNGTCKSYSSATPTAACSTVERTSTCNDGTWSLAPYANASCSSGCAASGVCAAASNNGTCTTYSSATPIGSCSSVSLTSICSNGSWDSTPLANASCSSGCATSGACSAAVNGTTCSTYSSGSVTGPATCPAATTSTCNNGSWSPAPYSNGSCTVSHPSCAASGGCGVTTHGGSCTSYSSQNPSGAACSTVSRTSTCSDGSWSTTPYAYSSCSAGCAASGACSAAANGASCTSYTSSSVTSPSACSSVAVSSTCNNGSWSTTPGTNASCTVNMRSCAASGGCPLTAHNGTCTSYSSATPSAACSTVDQTSTCNDGTWSLAPLAYSSCTAGCAASGACSAAANNATCNTYSSASVTGPATCPTVRTSTCSAGTWSPVPYTNATCTVSHPSCAASGGCPLTTHGGSCTSYSSATPSAACSTVALTSTCSDGSWSTTPYANASCTAGCAASGACSAAANGASCTSYSANSVTSPSACSSVARTSTCSAGSWSAAPYSYGSCTVAMRSCTAPDSTVVAHNGTWSGYSTNSVACGSSCPAKNTSITCNDGSWSGTAYNTCSVVTCLSCSASGACGATAHGGTCNTYSTGSVTGPATCPSATTSTCNNGSWSPAPYSNGSCTVSHPSCAASGGCPLTTHGGSCTSYSSQNPSGAACSTVSRTSTCSDGSWSTTPYAYSSCSAGCAASGACSAASNGASCTSYTASSVTSPSACSSVSRSSTCNNGSWSTTPGSYGSCSVNYRSCTAPDGTTVSNGNSWSGYSVSSVACGSSCPAKNTSITCNDGSWSGTAYNTCSVNACASCGAYGPCGATAHGGTCTSYASNAPTGACSSATATCSNGVWGGTIYSYGSCTAGCAAYGACGAASSGSGCTSYSSGSVTAPSTCPGATSSTCSGGSWSPTPGSYSSCSVTYAGSWVIDACPSCLASYCGNGTTMCGYYSYPSSPKYLYCAFSGTATFSARCFISGSVVDNSNCNPATKPADKSCQTPSCQCP